jgi:RimJ/RimL family protein N-acetyltransferase
MSLAFPSPYTLEAAQTWINLNLTPPFTAYVIALSSSPSAVIGGIGFTVGKDVSSHTAELGYWIGTEFAGKGIMTEVLDAFIDWMFSEKGEIKRLCAQVFAPQKASMRCLEKCGFVAEGVMRGHAEKFGEVMDMHIFGLTKDDWEERKKGSQEK